MKTHHIAAKDSRDAQDVHVHVEDPPQRVGGAREPVRLEDAQHAERAHVRRRGDVARPRPSR